MLQRLLQIWHFNYLLGPSYHLHKASVRSFPQRGCFPGEKSSMSTGTTAPGANSLLMGDGYPLQIPTGQKSHQPQCYPSLCWRGFSQSLLPFPGCPSTTTSPWPLPISMGLNRSQWEGLKKRSLEKSGMLPKTLGLCDIHLLRAHISGLFLLN